MKLFTLRKLYDKMIMKNIFESMYGYGEKFAMVKFILICLFVILAAAAIFIIVGQSHKNSTENFSAP